MQTLKQMRGPFLRGDFEKSVNGDFDAPAAVAARSSALMHRRDVPLTRFVFGTMPELQRRIEHPVLAFLDALLRGCSQAVVANNALSGVLVIVAACLQDVPSAFVAVFGALCATLAAVYLRLDRAAVQAGLFGFNGYLVGACLSHFSPPDGALAVARLLPPVAALSVFTVLINIALATMWREFDIPPFAFPFNIAAFAFLSGFVFYERYPNPFEAGEIPERPDGFAVDVDPLSLVKAIPIGVAQLFFSSEWHTGVIGIGAILVYSPISALSAVFASTLGACIGVAVGANTQDIYDGLWSYNPALTALVLSGLFYYPTVKTFFFAQSAAVLATLLNGALQTLLAPIGAPSLSFAFCITSTLFVLLKFSLSSHVTAMPLALVSVPEDHRTVARVTAVVNQRFLEFLGEKVKTAPSEALDSASLRVYFRLVSSDPDGNDLSLDDLLAAVELTRSVAGARSASGCSLSRRRKRAKKAPSVGDIDLDGEVPVSAKKLAYRKQSAGWQLAPIAKRATLAQELLQAQALDRGGAGGGIYSALYDRSMANSLPTSLGAGRPAGGSGGGRLSHTPTAARSKSYFRPSVTHIPQESIYAASIDGDEAPPQWIAQTDIELVFEQAGGSPESITLLDFLAVMMSDGLFLSSNRLPGTSGRFDRSDEPPLAASGELPLDSDANTDGNGGIGQSGNTSRNGKRFSAVFGRRSASALIVGGGGHLRSSRSAQEELNLTEMGGAARSVV